MIKPLEKMTHEELLEYAKDSRQTIIELHNRFLAGLILEIEAGDIHVEDIDSSLWRRLKIALRTPLINVTQP